MQAADTIPFAAIALGAIIGLRRGGTRTLTPLIGLAAGVALSGGAAPRLLGALHDAPWLPWATLVAATAGFATGLRVGDRAGAAIDAPVARRTLRRVDRLLGIPAGALLGVAVTWLGAALLVQHDAATRDAVRRSAVATRLLDAVPPPRGLQRTAHAGSLPVVSDRFRPAGLPAPAANAIAARVLATAARSVVKIRGTACGWTTEGSGWVAESGRVVTNLHVVTGETHPTVITPNGDRLRATTSATDAVDDLAILDVPTLRAAPLRAAASWAPGAAAAVLGYPGDGPLATEPATAGATTTLDATDAYGRPATRDVVPLRTRARHGASGGPVIDARGRVLGVLFASNTDGSAGYAVPLGPVRALLAHRTATRASDSCPRG